MHDFLMTLLIKYGTGDLEEFGGRRYEQSYPLGNLLLYQDAETLGYIEHNKLTHKALQLLDKGE